MNCKRCGALIPDDSKVCKNCGLESPTVYWQKSDFTNQTQSKKPVNNGQGCTYRNPSPSKQPNISKPSTPTVSEKKSNSSKWLCWLVIISIIVGGVLFFSNDARRLKGTWECEDGSYTITFSDGENGYLSSDDISYSYSQSIINFTYYTEGNELEIKTEGTLFQNSVAMRFEFEIDGKKLMMTEPESGIITTHYKVNL